MQPNLEEDTVSSSYLGKVATKWMQVPQAQVPAPSKLFKVLNSGEDIVPARLPRVPKDLAQVQSPW